MRSRMRFLRGRLGAVAAVIALFGLAGVAVAAPAGGGGGFLGGLLGGLLGGDGGSGGDSTVTDPTTALVPGGLLFASVNSRDGKPVLTASDMVPGEPVTGSLQIRSTGLLTGEYRLTASGLQDTPGPNGGRLSERLRLTVKELGPAGFRQLYDGTLADLHTVDLGRFHGGDGDIRTYYFTAVLPSTGVPPSNTEGDNAYQGASARVTLSWTGNSLP